jgi:hypothetical protein
LSNVLEIVWKEEEGRNSTVNNLTRIQTASFIECEEETVQLQPTSPVPNGYGINMMWNECS